MKYYIKTFGCQMNVSDSERIASFLELNKLKPAKNINESDLVVFNTCGVRQMAEDRVYGQIHSLRIKNKKSKIKIVVTGCLAHREDVKRRLKDKVDLFIEIKYITNISKWKNIFNNNKVNFDCGRNQSSLPKYYFKIRPKYNLKSAAYVPIMTGCNNFCSYCVVPYARGREISRSEKDIMDEINILSEKKYKEIILLGQNVNSYSFKNIKFPELLDKIARKYPEIKFRFLTSHPKDFSDELINVIVKNKNISREIHLPIQSGSDKILKAMNRPYTQKKYLDLITKIRKKIAEASFTTDYIVGFPGETEKDFQESIKVFKKVSYSEAYINKYSPRPGTTAWKLKETVMLSEKKRREKILRDLIKK